MCIFLIFLKNFNHDGVFFYRVFGNFHGLFWKATCVRILWVEVGLIPGGSLLIVSTWNQAAATATLNRASSSAFCVTLAGRCLHIPRVEGFISPLPVQSWHRFLSFLSFSIFHSSWLQNSSPPGTVFLDPPRTIPKLHLLPSEPKLPLPRAHSHCVGKSVFTSQNSGFHCLQDAMHLLTSGQLRNECISTSEGDFFRVNWVCSGSAWIRGSCQSCFSRKGSPSSPCMVISYKAWSSYSGLT